MSRGRTIAVWISLFFLFPFLGLLVGLLGGTSVALFLAGVVLFAASIMQPLHGLYFMLAIIPLQNLFLFGNATLVRIVGVVVFITWIADKAIRQKRFFPSNVDYFLVMLFVYLITAASSIIISSNNYLWESSFFTLIQLVIWVILLIDLIDSMQILQRALFCLIMGSFISFIVQIYNFYSVQEATRATGLFGGENASASLAIVLLPFLFSATVSRKYPTRLIGMGGVVLVLFAIGVSVTRTAILLVPLSISWALRDSAVALKGKRSTLLITLGAILITILFLPWLQIEERFEGFWAGDEIDAVGGRGWRAEQALTLFEERPITGYGLGNVSLTLGKRFVVHNLYLEILVQLGLVGLLAFVLLLIASWQYWIRAWKLTRRTASIELRLFLSNTKISIITYMIYSLSVSNQDSRLLWLLLTFPVIGYRLALLGKHQNPISIAK